MCARAFVCVCVCLFVFVCVCLCGVSLRQQFQWSIRVTAIFFFMRCAGVGRGCMGVGSHTCVYDTDLAIVISRAEVYISQHSVKISKVPALRTYF